MIGIYVIQNKINQKVYIGQSWNIQERLTEHKRNLRLNQHNNQHLQNAWNKYKEENFKFDILCDLSWINELDNIHAQHILDDCEILWIDYFGGANSNNTYNIREGGWGGKYSEEYCKHLSDSRKGKFSGKYNYMFGRHHTEETRIKISKNRRGLTSGKNNPMYGKKHSLETKQKISNSLKGRIQSEEEKQKRALSMKKWRESPEYKQKQKEINLKHTKYTEEVIHQLREEYKKLKNIKEVAKNNNMSYEVCRQIISHYGRFK